MSPPRIFPIGSGLTINGNHVTDHNRSDIVISPERIENRKRMANGTMRNFVVAQKVKVKTSWEWLPLHTEKTVDGFWGLKDLKEFYDATFSEFSLRITQGDNSPIDYLVMFDDFSLQLKRRGRYTDLYSLDITFEEV